MPFTPKTRGKVSTAVLSNTSVLKNEIAAEITPLFNAVKNAEQNTLKPPKINEMANILKPLTVNAKRLLS